MTVTRAFSLGLALSMRGFKALLTVWASNLIYAGLVAAPALFLIHSSLGSSLYGDTVRPFDVDWLADMFYAHQAVVPAFIGLALAAVLIYALLAVFLSGGLAGRLLDTAGGTTLREFFSDCGRYFLPFLKLAAFWALCLIFGLGLVWSLLARITDQAAGSASNEWPVIILSVARTAVILLLLSFLRLFLDYARIIMVTENERRLFKSLRLGAASVKGRFFKAWLLYLLLALFAAAGTFAGILIARHLAHPGGAALALGVVGMQVYIVFRVLARSLFITAQAEFLKGQPF
jgi:hypothetical protein